MTTIITHKQLPHWLRKLQKVPYLKCGSKAKVDPKGWEQQKVILEFPLGELAKDGLTTIALIGRIRAEDLPILPLTGKEGFNAQGIEGKVQVEKPFINALFNLRDLLPVHRGRIILK